MHTQHNQRQRPGAERQEKIEVRVQAEPRGVSVFDGIGMRAQWLPVKGVSPKEFVVHGNRLSLSVDSEDGIFAQRAKLISQPDGKTLCSIEIPKSSGVRDGKITLKKKD